MKKSLTKWLVFVVATVMLLILLLNYVLQIRDAREHMVEHAAVAIGQIYGLVGDDFEKIQELSYSFSNVTSLKGSTLYVADRESGMILESTQSEYKGKTINELGIFIPTGRWTGEGFESVIQKETHYCAFFVYDDVYFGVSQPVKYLYDDIPRSMFLVLLYLSVASFILIAFILYQVDEHILKGIHTLIDKLKMITNGELDTKVSVTSFPEFKSLSLHINQMTESLVGSTVRMSKILDAVDLLIGVYSYSDDKERVFASRKVGPLLLLSEEETEYILSDKKLFEKKIDEIRNYPVPMCTDTYRLPAETECYIKIESYTDNTGVFGVIIDVTEEIQEKHKLQHERDYDLLTELLSRRAFYQSLDELYEQPDSIKQAVMMMFDLDELKYINDNYGHANGDKAIREAANILRSISVSKKLIARLSGDEFAVFIYGANSREELEVYIQALYDTMLRGSIRIFEKDMPIRMSGGYVFCAEYQLEYTQLLKMADRAMYVSKRKGKAIFSPYYPEGEVAGNV